MKSRFAVSLLFILIASTFAHDASNAFGRFRSWTRKGGCSAVKVGYRVTVSDPALVSANKGNDRTKRQ